MFLCIYSKMGFWVGYFSANFLYCWHLGSCFLSFYSTLTAFFKVLKVVLPYPIFSLLFFFLGWQKRGAIYYFLYQFSLRLWKLVKMVGEENKGIVEDLNLSFEKHMMLGDGAKSGGKVKMEGGVITDWKDIPIELLLQIVVLVDDQMVIMASRVCRGWRDIPMYTVAKLTLFILFVNSILVNGLQLMKLRLIIEKVHRVLVDIVSAAANATPGLGRYPPFKRGVCSLFCIFSTI